MQPCFNCSGATSRELSWKPIDQPTTEHAFDFFYCILAQIKASRSHISSGRIDLFSQKAGENARSPFIHYWELSASFSHQAQAEEKLVPASCKARTVPSVPVSMIPLVGFFKALRNAALSLPMELVQAQCQDVFPKIQAVCSLHPALLPYVPSFP